MTSVCLKAHRIKKIGSPRSEEGTQQYAPPDPLPPDTLEIYAEGSADARKKNTPPPPAGYGYAVYSRGSRVRGAHRDGRLEGKEAQSYGGGSATRVGRAQAHEQRAGLDATREWEAPENGGGSEACRRRQAGHEYPCCNGRLKAASPGPEPGGPAPLAGRRRPPAGATPSGVASREYPPEGHVPFCVRVVCCVCGVGDRAPLVASGGVSSLRRVDVGEACSACVTRAALFATFCG